MIVLASDVVGTGILRYLLENDYEISAIVLHSADRGSTNADIRELAETHGLLDMLMDEAGLRDEGFLDRLTKQAPTLGILGWWPDIIGGRLLEIPRLGWLNVHPSLLPHNRGRHPNFWCLATGTPCGVTLHFADSGVDTGPIVAQEVIETSWEDTGATVFERARDVALTLFRENIDWVLAERITARLQLRELGSFHRSDEMAEASRIDLDAPTTARALLNTIRARTFAPHPSATFDDAGKTYSVRVTIEEVA